MSVHRTEYRCDPEGVDLAALEEEEEDLPPFPLLDPLED